jgi:hypothetical protein
MRSARDLMRGDARSRDARVPAPVSLAAVPRDRLFDQIFKEVVLPKSGSSRADGMTQGLRGDEALAPKQPPASVRPGLGKCYGRSSSLFPASLQKPRQTNKSIVLIKLTCAKLSRKLLTVRITKFPWRKFGGLPASLHGLMDRITPAACDIQFWRNEPNSTLDSTGERGRSQSAIFHSFTCAT